MRSPALKVPRNPFGIDNSDPALTLYVPLWHPDLVISPFISKDIYRALCIVTGATWTPGGMTFDGIDDQIQTGDTTTFKWLHGALNTSAFQWSIQLWVKLNDVTTNGIAYFLLGTGQGSSSNTGLDLYFQNDVGASTRIITCMISRGESSQTVLNFISGPSTYPNSTGWQCLEITYDQSLANTNFTLYLNGVLTATGNKTANAPSTANSTGALTIGRSSGAASPMPGTIGEVVIHSRCLTPSEVLSGYQTTKGRYV